MRFIVSSFLAVAALAGLVMSAENPIIFPDQSSAIVAGEPFVITWTPTTGGTVTFTLRQGLSNNLDDVEVIASDIPNSGTYQWTPEATLPAGTDYAIMITDEQGEVNYTPLITIQSSAPPKVSSSSSSSAVSSTLASSSVYSSSSSASAPASATKEISSTITAVPSYANSTLITSTTGYSNSTTTASGNSTHSITRSTTPTASPTGEAPSPTGAAAGLLRSPLALVVCVLGAVLYLN